MRVDEVLSENLLGWILPIVVLLVVNVAVLRWVFRRRPRAEGGFPVGSYFENTVDGVAQVDAKGQILRVNQQLIAETGFPVEALVGRYFAELGIEVHQPELATALKGISSGTRRRVEVKIRRAGGGFSDVAVHSVPIVDNDRILGAYEIIRDMTDQKRTEEELKSRALHDYLTGLPNRVLFADRLKHALDRAQRDGGSVALLYIDLDRFKPINDRDGHGAGDELLCLIASRLKATVRSGDSVARLGGDEFGVVVESVESRKEAQTTAGRILAAIRAPAEIEGKEQQVGASIGIAISSADTEGPQELVSQADLAMYEVKGRGGFGVELFRPELEELQTHKKAKLEGDLRRGIRRDELSLQYQPIVDAEELRVVAFEVLVRWSHPELGLLLPSTFIPIAEESSLVAEVDRWVLKRACRDLQDLMRKGECDDSVYLSVNLSGRHFQEDDMVDAVSNIILETGFDPDLLQLEITESAAGGDLSKVRRLKALGVKVAIDDFGTGFSSLSYVRDLDVDVLKVDKSFVFGLGADPSAVAIVRTIITLADMLSLGVIIEGIENTTQLEQLRALGAHLIQGYLFGRPMDLEAVPDFLRQELKPAEAQDGEDWSDTRLPPPALNVPVGALLVDPSNSDDQGLRPYWPI